MARTIFIVQNSLWDLLPSHLKKATVKEVHDQWQFAHMQVKVVTENNLPPKFAFNHAKIAVVDSFPASYISQDMRKQWKKIKRNFEKVTGGKLQVPSSRIASKPDRHGVSLARKEIYGKYAFTVITAAVGIDSVKKEYLSYSKEKLQGFEKAMSRRGPKDFSQRIKYLATYHSLVDTRNLMIKYNVLQVESAFSHPNNFKKWGQEAQERFGKMLGQIIAHEAFHQFDKIGLHDNHYASGLGSDSVEFLHTRVPVKFSKPNQQGTNRSIQKLERQQREAAQSF